MDDKCPKCGAERFWIKYTLIEPHNTVYYDHFACGTGDDGIQHPQCRIRELTAENEKLREAGRMFMDATYWSNCNCEDGCQACDKKIAARRKWQEVDKR